MPVKPSNAVPALKDRNIITGNLDLSAASTIAALPLFFDPDNAWEVVSVTFVPSVNYIASQAVTFSLGITGAATRFLNAVTAGTAVIAPGTPKALALGTTRSLPKNTALIATYANNASQTGEGVLVIKLRPEDTKYQSSKTPYRA